jgi:anthraniloyl-CoA monooxygenase
VAAQLVYVVGGGPAGLFAARLLRRAHPGWEVRLFERLPPDDTFGFGVGLTGGTLRSVRQADPEVCADLVDAAFRFSTAEFRLPQGVAEIPGFHSGVAIGRARLLRILLARAEAAGVKVETGPAPAVAELSGEASLVIAADGVSSGVRQHFAAELGARTELSRGLFFWCGSEVPLAGTVFMPVATEHGTFVAHAYPYAPGRSTFVIEASQQAVRRTGSADCDGGESDDAALEYLSAAFGELLGGGSFLGNRSRWTRFRTVRCARWQHGNVVLIGDAAATAHPTIGSGTKLALESAIALAAALADDDGVRAGGLARYEQARRPAVERLQAVAHRSRLWWESFPARLQLSPARLAAAFLTRTGTVSLNDLTVSAPELARHAAADFARDLGGDLSGGLEEPPEGDLTEWILRRPLAAGGRAFPQRLVVGGSADAGGSAAAAGSAGALVSLPVSLDDAWGPAADQLVARAARYAGRGATVIRLTGGPSVHDLRDRLAFGERLRTELNVLVQVDAAAAQLPEAAGGLVAGRADLVGVPELVDPAAAP